jgi:alpha-beta hydrolase superfamily lysophospholipase
MMKNESLKKLAHGLAEQHIASLRFDKRGIAESQLAAKSEEALRFEDYVNDARAWIELLKKDKRFLKVVVVGHSEGSLIGMIAANGMADGYVSIAGAGRSADKVIKEQLGSQPQQVIDMCFPIIDSLVAGKTVADVNPMLNALFRPSVQPYLISWFHYDPQLEIKKLTIPVLIIQGTNDIQVSISDANLLAVASPKAQLILVKNMNHIFRLVEGDRDANIATYSKGELPISEELVNSIALFTLKK